MKTSRWYALTAVATLGAEFVLSWTSRDVNCSIEDCDSFIYAAIAVPVVVLVVCTGIVSRARGRLPFRTVAGLAATATVSLGVAMSVGSSFDPETTVAGIIAAFFGFPIAFAISFFVSLLTQIAWPQRSHESPPG